MRTQVSRLAFNAEQLDLLDDVLAYYILAGMGGGDRDTPKNRAIIDNLLQRIAEARERLEEGQL